MSRVAFRLSPSASRAALLIGLVALTLAAGSATAGAAFDDSTLGERPVALATDDPVAGRPPVTPRQEAEAGADDPFHVSDETLATSIFLPLIFLVPTVALGWWAWSKRVRPGDADQAEAESGMDPEPEA